MGFFSLKANCAVCGNECGMNRYQIKEKLWCCPKCFKEAGLGALSPIKTMSPDDIKNLISKRQETATRLLSFQSTKSVGKLLAVDETKNEWYIPYKKNPNIHSYDEVIDFELLEDGASIVKGGIGKAVAGGLFFGGVGAIVGSSTGKKKTKQTCTSLKIKITLNDMHAPTEYIELITSETKKSGFLYQTCEKQAQEVLSILQIMCKTKKGQEDASTSDTRTETSSADEILKFKSLLDNGIITQEEFEKKKKQLLESQ